MRPCPATSSRGPFRFRRVFAALSPAESRYLAELLRTERVGGALLLVAAAVALMWANSPWRSSYEETLSLAFGPESLHLRLDLAHWAADGLLAVFFFVAGLELKREFLVGELRDPARAFLPVGAAVAGVVVPACVFLAVTSGDRIARAGWAVPVATDIAFALAVLAVLGSHLPTALRSFLLTLAVVDDLIAILIIAVVFTSGLRPAPLAAALLPLAAFAALARRRAPGWTLVIPGVVTWALVHASGVHATVAGVLLAFTVPALAGPEDRIDPASHLEHVLRPVSAGVAVPLFALTAAGVPVVGEGLAGIAADPVTWGVAAGLIAGKTVGVFGGTWVIARFTRAELDEALSWSDVLGISFLTGIGFTVSLLVADLAFEEGTPQRQSAKAAVLAASLVAAALAAIVLRLRERHYRSIAVNEPVPAP
jgi:NhaA family Na+:H+ antiporter